MLGQRSGMRNRLKLLAAAGLAGILFACAKAHDLGNLESPSDLNVETTADYPPVAMIYLPMGEGMCTGTFVSPRAVLTAAHCTARAGAYRVITSFGTYTTSTREVFGNGDVSDTGDLALLIFDQDVALPRNQTVYPIGDSVVLSENVRLVGFGCDDIDTKRGGGTKRTGTNQVYRIADFIELNTPSSRTRSASRSILGPVNRAGSCYGDSGGPLMRKYDGHYEVIGVCHAGGVLDGAQISQYVDITAAANSEFVRSIDRKYGLGIFSGCPANPNDCGYSSASAQIASFLQLIWNKVLSWF